MLELQWEMGVLRCQEFDAKTRLDVITPAVWATVDVMASPLALLVDQLRALSDRVRGLVHAGVHRGASEALAVADVQSNEYKSFHFL
jgi:hypothetical protein